jgi:hypothetical protein
MKRPREMRSDRGAVTARRGARLIVAMVAAGELRSVVASMQHLGHAHLAATLAPGSAAFWVTVLLAIGAAVLLRVMTRGLTVARPAPSKRLALTWACCSAALLGLLGARGVGSLGLGAVLPSIAVALVVGLLLAASLQGTRWILGVVARLGPRAPTRLRAPAPVAIPERIGALLPPAPLLAGWSDRGPPSSRA